MWNSDVHAVIFTAASCSDTHVAVAVSSAANGDTVIVPPGLCTWASSVTIPNSKKLIIQGAGKTATILTSSGNFFLMGQSGSRITGIGFKNGYMYAEGNGFRIDNCDFTSDSWKRQIWVGSRNTKTPQIPWGVIDNNTFLRSGVNVAGTNMIHSDDNLAAQHSLAAKAPSWGTQDSVYIESNKFDSGIDTVDSNYGGRYVYRFNTVSGTITSHVETHQAGEGAAPNRGVRYYEIYGNSLSGGTWVTMLLTGGTGMVFNNTITGNYGEGPIMLQEHRSCNRYTTSLIGACDGTSVWDGNTSGQTGWPCRDQIGRGVDTYLSTGGDSGPYNLAPQASEPMYLWGNTLNGSASDGKVRDACSAVHIKENRDFYNYNASFDGTSGVGVGRLAARPATCTAGVSYWATDQGNWNKSGIGGQGVLYKCTSTNTWVAYYTPLTFPHPLRVDTQEGSIIINAPKNLRMAVNP